MNFKAILVALTLCVSLVHSLPTEEIEAQKFIEESSNRMFGALNEISDLAYTATELEFKADDDSSEENSDSDEDLMTGLNIILQVLENLGKLDHLITNVTEISKDAAEFKLDQFKNKELKQALQQIHLYPHLMILGGNRFAEVNEAADKLEAFMENRDICNFHDKTKCQMNYGNDVTDVIRDSENLEEIKYYWQTWREKNKDTAKENIEKIIKGVHTAAKEYKVSPLLVWNYPFMDEKYIDEMEKAVNEIQPLYQQYHAFIRSALSNKFGESVVSSKGPIPHHLFEKIEFEAWSPTGILSNLFTKDNMTNFKKVFQDKKYDGEKIVKIADEFYRSLGLEDISSDFWTHRFKEIPEMEKTELECQATIYDLSSKVYFKYCPEVSIKKFLQVHGWVGRLHYANQKKDLKFAYFPSYDLEYGVGEAAILSALTAKHMNTIGLTENTKYDTVEHDMDRLFRMGVHTILNIPVYFVHAKVMNDVIAGVVELDKINDHYWSLMKKYVGVVPPVERQGNDFDFSYFFYSKVHENKQSRKFMSEVIGYQIYESLCVKSGQYEVGKDMENLHQCDFYGSTEAGKVLKEMMHLGSKKPWRQVLSTVTGNENGMSGRPILEYYKPIQQWLSKQNTENNVHFGW